MGKEEAALSCLIFELPDIRLSVAKDTSICLSSSFDPKYLPHQPTACLDESRRFVIGLICCGCITAKSTEHEIQPNQRRGTAQTSISTNTPLRL